MESNSFNVLFEYPSSEFGQLNNSSIFMICEIGDEIRPMVNATSSYYDPLMNMLDYLQKGLEAVSLMPGVNEFHPTYLLGELVINIKDFGLNLMLTYPGFVLLTLLVYKVKDELMVYQTGQTPNPSNISEKRGQIS